MKADRMRAVADAVLLEGYVLYPYRASSAKNRYRWAFGVLAPRVHAEGPTGADPYWLESQCLIEPSAAAASIDVRLRFLQLDRRTVEAFVDGGFVAVDSLDADGTLHVAWDEGEVREIELPRWSVARGVRTESTFELDVSGGADTRTITGTRGEVKGRVKRSRQPLSARVRVTAEPATGDGRLVKLTIRVENVTPMSDPSVPRDGAMPYALQSTHLLLSAEGGAFVSLLDPPDAARGAADGCVNVGTYPVLGGEEGTRDLVLSAPIILPDHPSIAPESHGDFFDATEIDELLTLRTSTLTDDERREVRATDERAAAILDRVDRLPEAEMSRLHGAVRELEPLDEDAPDWSDAPREGDRVRLRPSARRTDAQDLLFAGMCATVRRVMTDVDGEPWLALTLDDDPAVDLHLWHGRYHYYRVDEVEIVRARLDGGAR